MNNRERLSEAFRKAMEQQEQQQNPKSEPYRTPLKNNEVVENYKKVVAEVYDDKKEHTQVLIDACIKEDEMFYERVLNTIIATSIFTQPYRFARSVNDVLGTSYTDDDFEVLLKPYAERAQEVIKKYILETINDKKRKTAAQEMREVMDECNFDNVIKKALEDEPKPTFWQRVKGFFCRKKCKCQCKQ